MTWCLCTHGAVGVHVAGSAQVVGNARVPVGGGHGLRPSILSQSPPHLKSVVTFYY